MDKTQKTATLKYSAAFLLLVKKRSRQKLSRRLDNPFKWWYLAIPCVVLIGLTFWYLLPSPEQKFIDKVVEGSSPNGATLREGFIYASEQLPEFSVGQGISWGDVTDAAGS